MDAAAKPPSARHSFLALAVALSIVAAVMLLYAYDPVTAGFFPVCALHALTGWDCPGCGGLRAVHQLSHGNLAGAWHYNPLFVLLLPMLLWAGFRELMFVLTGRQLPGFILRPATGWTLLGILIAFGIIRNLPGFPKP